MRKAAFMNRFRSTAIIGAGISGLTMAKALKDRGVSCVLYEKSDQLGGNWVFRNKNGMSSAYRSLHIDSSRHSIEFDDFPFPKNFPDFPHHTQIRQYFNDYADHFKLRELIRFQTGVSKAERLPQTGWRLTLDDGEVRDHDLLVVANGHHWDPRWPEPPFAGSFNGPQIHSHQYIDAFDPVAMHGKKVLVVGIGNSAMDIACELSHRGVAEKLFLSTRRGAYVLPKYIFGRPLDKLIRTNPRLPMWPQRLLGAFLVRLAVGKMESYGLPRPAFKVWQAHPTVSSEFLIRLGSGDVAVKPNVAELLGDRVRFEDGSTEAVDVILYATGYKVTFPFFDADFLSAPDNQIPLFKRAFKPGAPDLMFVGLAQAVPSIIKFVEAQTRWLAAYAAGEYELPEPEEMKRTIANDDAMFLRHFVATKRHTIQTDTRLYEWDLAKEWKRGRARARKLKPTAAAAR
jgi:cation diffusion facilitator CzcD-associated flavoprotein CzcO